MPKQRKCTYCGKPGGDHRVCLEAWGLDYDPASEADAQYFLDRRRRIMNGETTPMTAEEYADEDRVGQRIYTQPLGTWPGGLCQVIEMFPDRDGATDIVMQVQRVEDRDECGVYAGEWVELVPTP